MHLLTSFLSIKICVLPLTLVGILIVWGQYLHRSIRIIFVLLLSFCNKLFFIKFSSIKSILWFFKIWWRKEQIALAKSRIPFFADRTVIICVERFASPIHIRQIPKVKDFGWERNEGRIFWSAIFWRRLGDVGWYMQLVYYQGQIILIFRRSKSFYSVNVGIY